MTPPLPSFLDLVLNCFLILFFSLCVPQVGVNELCAVPVLPMDLQLRGRRPVGQGLPDRHCGHALCDHIAGNGFGEPERPRSHIRHPS